MNKNRFTPEQEQFLRDNYKDVGSFKELTEKFNQEFKTTRKISQISDKLNKQMHLKLNKNCTCYGSKAKEQLPIGTIRESQGRKYIKVQMVSEKQGKHLKGRMEPYWLPLQKKVYQDEYGAIPSDQFVIFLNGNSNDFEIDNLYPINRKVSAIMSQNRWWTDSKENTLAGIKWCELWYAMEGER